MSDPTSIFNGQNPQETPATPAGTAPANVQIDPTVLTLLGEIKNERGEPKYKTLQDAIVALKHSQEYIPTLTTQLSQKDSELATARAEAAKIAELERTLQALTQKTTEEPTSPNSGLSKEQIAELVSQTLTQRQQEELAQSNARAVAQALQSQFGTEAEKKYNEKAAELGMTVAELNALAMRSPKAVLGMLGAKETPSAFKPQPSVNTAALQPHQETFVGRNQKSALIGATTEDMRAEQANAKRMVEELEAKGMSIDDLSNPKNYFKYFGKT